MSTMSFHTIPHPLNQSGSPGLPQAAETQRPNAPSNADIFGLGFVLIVMILFSRQLVISLHKRYQLHRIILSLQRRATLECQLHRKASSKPAFRKGLSR